jgi:multimeric flavodoxin WrbA
MKTLIFNGSPRRNGDTSFLVRRLVSRLDGDVNVIITNMSSIRPCQDCRYCWTNAGCCINDDMQLIYSYVKECDNIVIASPMYFSELAGSLLNVLSRLQTFYASKRFLNIQQIEKRKRGAVILCGGGDGYTKKSEETAATLLKFMNASVNKTVFSLKTDEIPSCADQEALRQTDELADMLNSYGCCSAT